MENIEFNLIREPWIKVLMPDGRIQEVSLKEALLNSHEYSGLGGELAAQDVAVLRLLLAVLQTVFYRVNADGEGYEDYDADSALKCWETIWNAGKLPEKPITDYLEAHSDDFWLFHPTRPFGQVPGINDESEYKASKLVGEIIESGHKKRLFLCRSNVRKEGIHFSEAARWLLYTNAFDDCAVKKGNKYRDIKVKLESPGQGWLGKLGLIYASGDNLFETLMLNLVLIKNKSECWGEAKPNWEIQKPKIDERIKISVPDNQAELLTLQSRRILLERDDNMIIAFHELSGDFFEPEKAYIEQMTEWKKVKDSKDVYLPKQRNLSRQFWRDFGDCFVANTEGKLPGVVIWVNSLVANGFVHKNKIISFLTVGLGYDKKTPCMTIGDSYGVAIAFRASLLSDRGASTRKRIDDEIVKCDKCANAIGMLAKELYKASGGTESFEKIKPEKDPSKIVSDKAKEQFYHLIDDPFRKWLEALDPEFDDEQREDAIDEWRKEARTIALRLGNELVEKSGSAAFEGRYLNEKKKGKDNKSNKDVVNHYSSPLAFNLFIYRINHIYNFTTTERSVIMDKAAAIKKYVAYKINRISSADEGSMKAELANLRRGIGRKPGDMPELWDIFLRDMPEELQSASGEPSRAEWAIYTALTLYALHQQGSDPKTDRVNLEGAALGRALRALVPPNNKEKDAEKNAEKRVLHRFNQAATASDMTEMAYHLRGLVQLLRAEGVKLDYPALAGDLYWYQYPEKTADVRLRWGQDFYWTETKKDEESEKTQE